MKRGLLYVLLTLALLYVVREVLYVGVRRNARGEFARLRETFLEKHPCDILIIGSSRAEGHFYPPVIDSATQLHTFNIGMSGATLPFIRTTLEAYLENSPAPKYVVLNIDWHSFNDNPDTVYLFPRYFPYLANKKLAAGLAERDGRFPFFNWIAPYSMPYFGTRYVNAAIRGYTGKLGQYDTTVVQGWTPVLSKPGKRVEDYAQELSDYEIKIPKHVTENIDRIDAICKSRNIELILVISPIHTLMSDRAKNKTAILDFVRNLAKAKQRRLFDYSSDSMCTQVEWFADPAHLNRAGSIVFSRKFALDFAQYLRPQDVFAPSAGIH